MPFAGFPHSGAAAKGIRGRAGPFPVLGGRRPDLLFPVESCVRIKSEVRVRVCPGRSWRGQGRTPSGAPYLRTAGKMRVVVRVVDTVGGNWYNRSRCDCDY